MSRRVLLSVLMASALLASVAAADTGAQPVAKGMLLNGAEAPSGSTLIGNSVLSTLDRPATVNLVNGQTFVLAPNSKATFESTDSGEIRVAVNQGSASYRGADGIVVAALENEFLLASQDGVQQGVPVEQSVAVCLLTAPTDPVEVQSCLQKPNQRKCDWQREDEAYESELDRQGAHYIVISGDGADDFDCHSKAGWIALLGAAAVGGSGSTAAIVAGAVLGSAVIIDRIDEPSSSPTRPGG